MNLLRVDPDLLVLDLIGDDERGYDFLTDEEVLRLKRIRPHWGILSVYLDIDPDSRRHEAPAVQLRHGLEQVRKAHAEGWTHEQRTLFDALAADIREQVERLLQAPRGRGVALFAAPARVQPKKGAVDCELFLRFSLPEPPGNRVEWGDAPALAPLLVQRVRHPDTGVVLFDREKGRFFLQHMGEVAEYDFNLMNPEPVPLTRAHTWHGYGEHNHHQWQEEHYRRYLRQAALVVAKVAEKAGWHWLVLGSPDEQEARHLQEHLPKALGERVIGTFALPLDANLNQVREAVLPFVEGAVAGEERQVMDQWRGELARDGGRAVAGIADTLLAGQEYRIHTLLMTPGLRVEGGHCRACGGLSVAEGGGVPDSCPYCGGSDLERLPDLFGALALQVLAGGGRVEVVQQADHRAELEARDGVGALLRW